MKIEEFAAFFQLDPVTCDFMAHHGFAEAEASYCDPPPGLTEAKILDRWHKLELSFDPAPVLRTAARARASEEIKHLYHYLAFYWWRLKNCEPYGYRLARFDSAAGSEDGAMLELVLALDGCDAIEATHARLGLPPEYARAIEKNIAFQIGKYLQTHGRPGYPESGHHWARFSVEGRLFRLGRLEYMIEPAPLRFTPAVFRRRRDGRVIALCRDGWRLNREGLQLWRDEPPESAYCTALLDTEGDRIRGIPVNPAGFAEVDRSVVLPRGEFEPLWSDWDLVPDVHIPGGGNMRIELCLESFREAMEFFPRYFHRTPAGFTSVSWIFNPDFAALLPDSNLARFMRELYLGPFASSGLDGLNFVFGREAADWSDFPEDNSLRRAFHNLRRAGRRLKCGSMFLEARGMAQFGSQIYRREFPDVLPARGGTLHRDSVFSGKTPLDS